MFGHFEGGFGCFEGELERFGVILRRVSGSFGWFLGSELFF